MFEYCVRALRMSEAEAYLRIGAARLSREFPRVLDMLQAGELHLSALKLLAPVLTPHNANELLEASRFKSKRDLEVLLAARFEKPDVPNTLRKLPQARPAPVAEPELTACARSAWTGGGQRSLPAARRAQPRATVRLRPSASASARPSLGPLGPGRYKLQLTASQALHDKLQQARDLMRHELPEGDLAQVVERALDLLIQDRMKRRFGVGRKAKAHSSRSSASLSRVAVTSRTRSGGKWWRAMTYAAPSSVPRAFAATSAACFSSITRIPSAEVDRPPRRTSA